MRRPARALELAAELERLAVDLIGPVERLDEGDVEDGGGDGLAQRLPGVLASTIGAGVARQVGADVKDALLGAEIGRDEGPQRRLDGVGLALEPLDLRLLDPL